MKRNACLSSFNKILELYTWTHQKAEDKFLPLSFDSDKAP